MVMINFDSMPDENLLIGKLTSKCTELFNAYGDCAVCSHPSGRCSGSCRDCAEQVNFHQGGRSDYNCQKFLYYYVCRYSWKYCSEIMYALENINLSKYGNYNILSIGCGGAPDLMAFEQVNRKEKKPIYYRGFDLNSLWEPIHKEIIDYVGTCDNITADLLRCNIFDIIDKGQVTKRSYNIIILEYLLSHFSDEIRVLNSGVLFRGLIDLVLACQDSNKPFLLIINDIDHKKVRQCYKILFSLLVDAGYHGSVYKRHFKDRNTDYGDGSVQYSTAANKFMIPYTDFDCAIKCSSAQLIVELEARE